MTVCMDPQLTGQSRQHLIVFMDTIKSEVAASRHVPGVDADDGDAIEGVDVASVIGGRVKLARGATAQQDLADAIGVHSNTVSKIERGKAVPDASLILKIAKATDVSAAWLLLGSPFPQGRFESGHGDGTETQITRASAAESVPMSLVAVEVGDYIYVPHFDIAASAGPGVFNDLELVKAMRPFERSYIRHALGISHNELALVGVRGRSMEPLLHPSDVAMLDRRDCDATTEGVHMVRLDGALLIKSLQRLPGRTLRVSSKNQAEFPPFDITADDDGERDFQILGRLRWAGITLN